MSDPRSRLVLSHERVRGGTVAVALECGHVQRRKFLSMPQYVICEECPVPADWAARNLHPHKAEPLPEVARPILERMASAKRRMIDRRRTPRAFYLNAADFSPFEATEPPTITATFGGLPVEVLGFEGLAVRRSQSQQGNSVLYCCIGTGVGVPIR